MRLSCVVFGLLLLTGICLVGCDKSLEPTMEPSAINSYEPDLESLQAAAWPRTRHAAPSPLVTVDIGLDAVEFWPYTGADLSGTPKDPINLIFFGQADPRDIRAALLSLDGDRTAFGMPSAPPFSST